MNSVAPKAIIMAPGKNNKLNFRILKAMVSADIVDGGYEQLMGVITEEGAPVSREVWLLQNRDGRIVRKTWSDTEGHYKFSRLAPKEYIVISLDYHKVFNAVISDGVTVEEKI